MLNYIEIYRNRDKKLYDNKLRMVTFNLGFDIDPYVKWMDQQKIDGRLINFAYLNREIFDRPTVNPRSYTMFANSLSSIKNFNDQLPLINLITKGAFDDEDGVICNMFIQFLNNKLDTLMDPQELLKGEWSEVKIKLESNVYNEGNYRPDIASILTTRLCNYLETYFKETKDSKKTDKLCTRLVEIIDEPKMLLSEDIFFRLIRYLKDHYPTRIGKLLLNPKLQSKILC